MSGDFSLAGKLALVIGGSSGLGRAIALGYADAGAQVVIAGRTPAKVDAVCAELRARSGDGRGYAADVADLTELRGLLDRLAGECGAVDILVNSQGTTVLTPAEEVTPEEYRRIMETNLTSVFFACTWVGRTMLQRGAGSIVNISSIAAHIGFPLSSVYDASKHGVLGLTRTLATEWAERGVRVNAIAPGVFMTPLNEEKMSPQRKADALRRTPMNRFGDHPEVVGAAVYLASPAASYVTGSTITVDGGWRAAAL
jgi:NAD(P)-dependent dehydrogenase (short-subunit alcohol dehydrogenase family)